jgi:hypothetical protein
MLLLLSLLSLLLVISIVFPTNVLAQSQNDYDEILVYVEIPRVGGFEIPAIIRGNEIYLAVTDLFDFLKVRNTPSQGLDSISGFFINREATYLINYPANKIRFQDRIYTVIKGDLIRTESNLYLKSDYLGRIFGLECNFNFRSLTVTINSKLELPVIKEMRLEEMRRNMARLKGEIKADTNLGRTHPFFRLGMADWTITGTEVINGKSNATGSLALGGMVAGGETTISLYHNSMYDHFSEKQQQYLWRYVDNDFTPLRQVAVGKINSQALATLYNPVIGVQFTNTPTTFRRSFGSYKLSDRTDPGWTVELYVNNVLVDYMKADASGFFTFDVPLVYGNSAVKLKFYGPWGEERTREQNIVIPYNFLPVKTMEYSASAGIVEDSLMSRFSRTTINYGLTRSLTIGGGYEYLSSVTSGSFMPFINGSLRITNNILVAGDFAYGVRAKGAFSYRLPSNIQLDLNYTWYKKGQTAIDYLYREERKASLSLPIRLGKILTFQRLSVYQIVLPGSYYTTGEWLFSGSLFGVNTNLTTYGIFIGATQPNIYSNLSLAFRLPARFTLMPQIQYGYTQNALLSARLRLEKMAGSHGFLYLQYERNLINNINLAEVGIRYDFSFAQVGFTTMQSNTRTALVQYARGSLIADTKTEYLKADNSMNVGKGGITVIAYLDINANGGRDPGEPRVNTVNLHANGGRIVKNESDTTIRILGLEPYTSCFIELDADGFENISWRLPVKTLSVVVDPDILKVVKIPISVQGEASGNIEMKEGGVTKGAGRIIVNFFNYSGKLAGRTLTEDNGSYNYLGLAPGEYNVLADSAQMRKLEMHTVPGFRKFSVKASKDGDYVTGLDFIIMKNKPDTAVARVEKPIVKEPEKPVVKRDTVYMKIHEVSEQTITVGEDSYAVQLGAFRKRSNAEAFRKRLESILGRKVEIVIENDLYKVRVSGLKDRKEVDDTLEKLRKSEVSEVWIITLRANQQQRVLIDRIDSVRTITEKPVIEITPEMAIQAGAFRREEFAIALTQKIASATGKPVIIIHEDDYYKVRITGFRNMQEIDKIMPMLGMLGLKDLWIPPVKKQVITKPEIVQPDTTGRKIQEPVKPLQNLPDTTTKIKPEKKAEEKVTEEKPVVKVPPFSLHVGEFRNHTKALRAQKKVASKLKRDVEIYILWDSYHLMIPGFSTREETFPLYPELAGMGYTNIYVIEKK